MNSRRGPLIGSGARRSVSRSRIDTRSTAGPIRKMHDFLTVGAPAPLQEAGVAALAMPETYYAEMAAGYARRRELLCGILDRHGFKFKRPQGAYYVMIDISEFGSKSDVKFCEWMAREVGVAAVPGSSFFHEPVTHLIRLHFAKRSETLVSAGEQLVGLRKKFESVSCRGAL